MSNQPKSARVLCRSGARTLTREEAEKVTGGQSQTFAFTHVITPDTTHD